MKWLKIILYFGSIILPTIDAIKGISLKLYQMKHGTLKIANIEEYLKTLVKIQLDEEKEVKKREMENIKGSIEKGLI